MKRNLVIYVNNKCNLNCSYCFVKKENKVLDIEHYKTFLKEYKKEILSVTFFGGEPLLDFELIKKIISYNKQQGCKYIYTINTNGILIDKEIISFCKENQILLNISLDGNKKSNAKNRFNEDIFNCVYDNIETAINDGIEVIINYVITPNNIEYVNDSLNFFFEHEMFRINILLNYDAVWKKEDIILLKKQIEKSLKILNYTKNNEYMKIHPIWNKMSAILSNDEIIKCKFGKDSIVLDTDGKIYPCISFPKNREYEIVSKGIEFSNIVDTKKCEKCEYIKFCSNNCMCRYLYKNNESEIDVNCECEKIFIDIAKKAVKNLVNHNK